MLRATESCKISRFEDPHATYSVEVSICSRQLRKSLCPHEDHHKGIIRQQPFVRPDLGARRTTA